MKTKEFYMERAELYAENLRERYGVQRDKRKRYVIEPFPSKEKFIDTFKCDLDDPSEELEDFDNLTREEDQKLVEEVVNLVAKAYDEVSFEREEFLGAEEI